jgi:chemotaxis protein MotB
VAERSGVDITRVPNVRKKVNAGAATPWVLLVFVLGVSGFLAYELYGRVKVARAQADRATAELGLTRERAFEAERKAGDAQSALGTLKAENEQLRSENATLTDENKKVAAKAEKADALAAELAKTVGADEGEVNKDAAGKLTLDLLDKVLFRTGEAELTPAGKKVLQKVGEAMNKYPDRNIWVIGHTDNVPIKTPEFPSNWELSTARALSVVHFLVDEVKVDPKRLAVAGMGPHRPVSKTNKARNRRIEIVLFPKEIKYERP